MQICRLLRIHSLFHLSVVRKLVSRDIWTLNEFIEHGEDVATEILLPACERLQLEIVDTKDAHIPLLRARAVLLAAKDMKITHSDNTRNTRRKSILAIENEFLNARAQSV